ncbi:MAG: D-aminoacyl-tRNA deacylase [Bacteroidia bacterium]
MRVLLQRVSEASVAIDNKVHASIGKGLLVLVGVESDDSEDDEDWLVKKITQMRIFEDENGKMNRSLVDLNEELLVISQFTLHASTKKGNRPSFIKAARPEQAIPAYERFIKKCSEHVSTKSGVFGADMNIVLQNYGPVSIWLDSKQRE